MNLRLRSSYVNIEKLKSGGGAKEEEGAGPGEDAKEVKRGWSVQLTLPPGRSLHSWVTCPYSAYGHHSCAEKHELLSVICRSNHVTVVRLLGASISGDYIYLVYEFVKGANLADCLRNVRNPDFTVLSSWISRIRIAADLAHTLDYVHNKTSLNMNLVHNHFSNSSVIVTEPSLNAKICHFGTAQLCGEVDDDAEGGKPNSQISTLPEEGEEG
ncbi:Probable serine/threonine-protein kinase PBL28 [Linum grandiflorum]